METKVKKKYLVAEQWAVIWQLYDRLNAQYHGVR